MKINNKIIDGFLNQNKNDFKKEVEETLKGPLLGLGYIELADEYTFFDNKTFKEFMNGFKNYIEENIILETVTGDGPDYDTLEIPYNNPNDIFSNSEINKFVDLSYNHLKKIVEDGKDENVALFDEMVDIQHINNIDYEKAWKDCFFKVLNKTITTIVAKFEEDMSDNFSFDVNSDKFFDKDGRLKVSLTTLFFDSHIEDIDTEYFLR